MNNFETIMMANLEINDLEGYKVYEEGFFPILKRHNGVFITYDDQPEHKEGDQPLNGRVILIGFPTDEDAQNWFNDPEYQALSEHRRNATNTHSITFVKVPQKS